MLMDGRIIFKQTRHGRAAVLLPKKAATASAAYRVVDAG
jgi:hypothetical protein